MGTSRIPNRSLPEFQICLYKLKSLKLRNKTCLLRPTPMTLLSWQKAQAATSALQEYVDTFHQWAMNWTFPVNAGKCANVTFTNRRSSCPGVSLNESPIRALPAYKYLGVTLDKKLTFVKHITCIQHSFRSKVARMALFSHNAICSHLAVRSTLISPY